VTSFRDQSGRSAFTSDALALVALRPDILGLGTEISLLAENAPEFDAYLSLLADTVRAIKSRSPGQAVTVSFQWDIQGRGLFAAVPIVAGEIVAVKGGHIFDRATLERVHAALGSAEIQIAEDLFIGPLEASEREGSMIFSNHSCEPNLGVAGQVIFVALRDIDAGEELTHDWAMTDDDANRMECRCGAPACRKTITGQDWRRRDLQEKYLGFFSWYLEEKIRASSKG
jgi:hypothetical protein